MFPDPKTPPRKGRDAPSVVGHNFADGLFKKCHAVITTDAGDPVMVGNRDGNRGREADNVLLVSRPVVKAYPACELRRRPIGSKFAGCTTCVRAAIGERWGVE